MAWLPTRSLPPPFAKTHAAPTININFFIKTDSLNVVKLGDETEERIKSDPSSVMKIFNKLAEAYARPAKEVRSNSKEVKIRVD